MDMFYVSKKRDYGKFYTVRLPRYRSLNVQVNRLFVTVYVKALFIFYLFMCANAKNTVLIAYAQMPPLNAMLTCPAKL